MREKIITDAVSLREQKKIDPYAAINTDVLNQSQLDFISLFLNRYA